MLIGIRCVTLLCRHKTARHLHSVGSKLHAVHDILMCKHSACYNYRNVLFKLLLICLCTADNLLNLAVIIHMLHICKLFIGKSQMSSGLWSLDNNKVRCAVVSVCPHFKNQICCSL